MRSHGVLSLLQKVIIICGKLQLSTVLIRYNLIMFYVGLEVVNCLLYLIAPKKIESAHVHVRRNRMINLQFQVFVRKQM